MKTMQKKAIVVHSGGMDSTICLALAMKKYHNDDILSVTFSYGQRHSTEIDAAKKICEDWNIDNKIIPLDFLATLTDNALIGNDTEIQHPKETAPNTLIVGRNGLMARLSAIHVNSLGGNTIFMGVVFPDNSGYRDCSREYMDLMEQILRIDLDDNTFTIQTPLVTMTKKETIALANDLNILEYIVENTITCYEGIKHPGCQKCPACILRNNGLADFIDSDENQ